MTPEEQTAAVEAALAAEREERIARHLDTYKRGLASWLAELERQSAAQQQKAEN